MISSEKVFSLLSVKDGMTDDRYFVGREVLLSLLTGCVAGSQRSPAWIYGPRRIGKSTIARALYRKAAENDTFVVWVDAIDLDNSGIESALHRAVEIASKKLKFSDAPIRKSFEELAAYSESRPVIVIFDEFDKIALNLQTDDQAYLRRLATDYDRFCYLFITRLPPSNIVKEIPEIHSRILGICSMQKVMPLERRNIKELCYKVSKDLNINDINSFEERIWQYTGGFSVAMTSMLKRIAVALYHGSEISDDNFEDLIIDSFNELKIDLLSYWKSLSSETRSVILSKSNHENFITSLKEDGFYSRMYGLIIPKLFLLLPDEQSAPKTETDTEEVNIDILEILKQGETHHVEFKSTLRYDIHEQKVNKKLGEVILKTIAAFSNGLGGCLIMGVTDDMEVIGLENDYKTLTNSTKDGFELHFRNMVNNAYGIEFTSRNLIVTFPVVDDTEICLVEIKPGLKPLYTMATGKSGQKIEKFYVRSGNSSLEMPLSEVASYIQNRFNSD